jgi:hypothetical protein
LNKLVTRRISFKAEPSITKTIQLELIIIEINVITEVWLTNVVLEKIIDMRFINTLAAGVVLFNTELLVGASVEGVPDGDDVLSEARRKHYKGIDDAELAKLEEIRKNAEKENSALIAETEEKIRAMEKEQEQRIAEAMRKIEEFERQELARLAEEDRQAELELEAAQRKAFERQQRREREVDVDVGLVNSFFEQVERQRQDEERARKREERTRKHEERTREREVTMQAYIDDVNAREPEILAEIATLEAQLAEVINDRKDVQEQIVAHKTAGWEKWMNVPFDCPEGWRTAQCLRHKATLSIRT